MPLYEYKCDSCGTVFEVIQRFSDNPLTVHEGCGGRVERLISTSVFNFKGTGWYATDYAHKRGGNGSKSGSAADAKADTRTEAKSETKSDSKPSSAASTETSKSG